MVVRLLSPLLVLVALVGAPASGATDIPPSASEATPATIVRLTATGSCAESAALAAAGAEQIDAKLRLWRLEPATAAALLPGLDRRGAIAESQPEQSYDVAVTSVTPDPLEAEEWWRTQIGIEGLEAPGPGVPVTIVDSGLDVAHPEFAGRPDITRCYQTLFTSAETTTGDRKQTIVCPPGSLDRSPCGTGTSARVAALLARGEIGLDQPLRFEGVLGTCFSASAVAAEERGGILYVRPKVTGRAFLTGFHQFVLDPDDPLPDGFRIGFPPRPAPDPAAWS